MARVGQGGGAHTRAIDAASVIGHLPDAFAVYDAQSRLVACNEHFLATFAPDERQAVAPDADVGPEGELLQRTRDGRWYHCRAKRTKTGNAVCTYRDVTAFKAAEADMNGTLDGMRRALVAAHDAVRRAERAAQARVEFIAAMSHELRTPLNAILGFSEMLVHEILGPVQNERYHEYARIIHESGSHVLGLINDVLDMSKLDAGKLELEFASVDLGRLLVDCVHSVQTQARKSGVGLCIELHNGVDRLDGDEKRLKQMLLNLLSNAVKFTPEGGEVRISVFRRGGSIAIAVSDSGIGMKEDDIPRALEPFCQIKNALARKHEGTGLGLPLTKELAEQHGGTLTLESVPDFGTTATLVLPGVAQRRAA